MKVLARKIEKSILFQLNLIVGVLIMAAAFIAMPIGVFSIDVSLLTNLFVWAVVLAAMLMFGSVGYFCFLRPYLLFRRLPEVQAETDGTYLYIHSTKEAKIPLAEMDGTYLDFHMPYMMSREFVIHILSERCGNVTIKVPKYGKYKLYNIAGANEVPGVIAAVIEGRPD